MLCSISVVVQTGLVSDNKLFKVKEWQSKQNKFFLSKISQTQY